VCSGHRAEEDTIHAMSADGRYTVFVSGADDLSPDDDNRFINVFRRDNLTGETILVSRADGPGGAAANDSSAGGSGGGLGGSPVLGPAISADGRIIAFQSSASNLVPGDTNGVDDVFVRDVVAGTTVRASVGPGGAEIPTGGGDPDISGDGTKVVFTTATAVDALKDGNNKADIYVRDLAAGTTALVRRRDGQDTVAGGDASTSAAISDDGTTVAFQSASTDLDLTVPDGNAKGDIFIRRLAAGQTRLVSVRASVAQTGDDTSFAPAIDATGARVAFVSMASNLAPFDINGGTRDVFVRDTIAGTTTLVSRSTGATGVSGNNSAGRPSISADGTRVAFESLASDLVPGDINSGYDIYVRDIPAATTELVSRTHTGAQIGEFTTNPSLSANGDCIAFQTPDASVVPGLVGTDFQRSFVRALHGDCPFGPVAAAPPPADPGTPGTTPAAGDTTRPRITLLRAVPKRFTAGTRYRAATRTRLGVGTRLRIRTSEPCRVVLRVVAPKPGRRVGKRCVVTARTGRKCIRATTRGTLNAGRVANVRRVVFTGRVRGRLLPPGRYRLVATATDTAGNRLAPRAIIVTIVKKPPARAA
jgi:Tol biopolymer transport system component